MSDNIYDNKTFFDNYIEMRNDKENISANEVVEMPAIYAALPNLKGKRVLDLGCGCGNNCMKAVEMGASYVLGTDISKNMIELHESGKIKLSQEDLKRMNEINTESETRLTKIEKDESYQSMNPPHGMPR